VSELLITEVALFTEIEMVKSEFQ